VAGIQAGAFPRFIAWSALVLGILQLAQAVAGPWFPTVTLQNARNRALLLGSIPVAALFGVLRIEQLYVVGLLSGVRDIRPARSLLGLLGWLAYAAAGGAAKGLPSEWPEGR